jgi:glycosyltransferase involved in cell wall biosynthesis
VTEAKENAEPEVSLIVIAFNEEAHIETCLRSIFSQESPATFEVIVVDDASTDQTNQIVGSLQQDHDQLHLIRHPQNRGRGAARRTGQDHAVASTIGFIDSDILLPPDWLARAVSALEHGDAVSGVAVPDGDCAVIWRMFRPAPKGKMGYWALTGNNVIFRRSALEKVGWPAESRCSEDSRMATAMLSAGLTVTTVRDLKVEHHEAKSYRQAMAFMHETGFNADEILRDLRRVRPPDLVWLSWTAVLTILVALIASGSVPWWLGCLVVLGVTIAIDLGAVAQRFYFLPHPVRWLVAAVANLPLIATYLGSRTFYLPRLLLRRRSVLH